MPSEFTGRLLASRSGRLPAAGRYLPLSLFALTALLATRRLQAIRGGATPAGGLRAAGAPPRPAGAGPASASAPEVRAGIAGGENADPSPRIQDLARRFLGREVEVLVRDRKGPITGTVAGRLGSLLLLSRDATPIYIDAERIVALRRAPGPSGSRDRGRRSRHSSADPEDRDLWDEPAEEWEEDWETDGPAEAGTRRGSGGTGKEGFLPEVSGGEDPAPGPGGSHGPAGWPVPGPDPVPPAPDEARVQPAPAPGDGASPSRLTVQVYVPASGRYWQLIHIYRAPRRRVEA